MTQRALQFAKGDVYLSTRVHTFRAQLFLTLHEDHQSDEGTDSHLDSALQASEVAAAGAKQLQSRRLLGRALTWRGMVLSAASRETESVLCYEHAYDLLAKTGNDYALRHLEELRRRLYGRREVIDEIAILASQAAALVHGRSLSAVSGPPLKYFKTRLVEVLLQHCLRSAGGDSTKVLGAFRLVGGQRAKAMKMMRKSNSPSSVTNRNRSKQKRVLDGLTARG